jgi:hypothetical protein
MHTKFKLMAIFLTMTVSSIFAEEDCYKVALFSITSPQESICSINIVDGEEKNCEEGETSNTGQNLDPMRLNECVDIESENFNFDSADLTNKNQPRLAMAFLIQMQDTTVYMTEKSVSVLLGLIHSSFYKKYPKLISRALLTLVIQRPKIYKQLVKDHPKLLDIDSNDQQSLCSYQDTEFKNEYADILIKSIYNGEAEGNPVQIVKEWENKYQINFLINRYLTKFEKEFQRMLEFTSEFPEDGNIAIATLIDLIGQFRLALPRLKRAKKDQILAFAEKYIKDASSFGIDDEKKEEFLSTIIRQTFYPDEVYDLQVTALNTHKYETIGPSLFSSVKKEGYEIHPTLPSTYVKDFTPEEVMNEEEPLLQFSENKEEFKRMYSEKLKTYSSNMIKDLKSSGTYMGYWKGLLTPENMKFFSKKEKEDLIDKISDTFVTNSQRDNTNLDPSSMYYLSYNSLAPLVGLEKKELTKVDTDVEGNSIKGIIASTEELEGVEKNKYGFYLQTTTLDIAENSAENPTDEDPSNSVTNFKIPLVYKQKNKEYLLEVDVNRSQAFMPIQNNIESPDYEKMNENGKIGLIVLGDNYKKSSDSILGNVINLYTQEQGYVPYSKTPITYRQGEDINNYYKKFMVDVPDTKAAIQKQIESGHVDYFIKLEHAQGNTTNLLTAAKESKVITFYKPGTKDKLFLVLPSESNKKEKQTITGQDFGKWMSKRKVNSDNPLDLFSGSCGSQRQTKKMVSHLMLEVRKHGKPGDKLPLSIYPTTSLTAFNVGNKNHPTNAMMNAYLGNKSYKEIEEAMKKTKIHQQGHDQYIFPSNEEYNQQLIGEGQYSYAVELDVLVKDHEKGTTTPLKSLSEQLH